MLLEFVFRFVTTLALFALACGLYLATDRLFFSPLRSVPGPKIAALTGWYETYYDVVQPGQYVFKIKELHKKYGPIVRITPRQVSISDCEYLSTIYEGGPNSKRDKDYEMIKAMGFNSSMGGAWQHDLHKSRRQPLNSFFSQGMVLRFGPEVYRKGSQLHQMFESSSGKAEINLSDVYFAYAVDMVNQFVFGRNQNVLSNMSQAHAMRTNVAGTLKSAKVNLQFPWIRNLVTSLPPSIAKHFAPAGVSDIIRFRMGIRQEIQIAVSELESQSLPRNPSVFRELLQSPLLPPSEKAIPRLEDEGTLMIMAGTESPAKSICIAHFYLLHQPDTMTKLRAELRATRPNTLVQLLRLPYLNAIAMEANRLSFGLTGRNSRVAHDALVYTDHQMGTSYKLPAGTPLSTSTLLVHTDDSIFPDPWAFDPERFLGAEGQARKKYMLAFGKGTRMCIGMNLANAEMAVAIAEMARWDMGLYETDEGDVKFAHDLHVAHPRRGSRGVRVKVLREVEI